MDLCVLDVQSSQVEISVNGGSEENIKKALDNLDEVLANVDLGVENTISHIGDSYITTEANANWFESLYPGWIFSKVTIKNL